MVDEIYVNTIKEFGLYDEIWQAFAVFLPIKSVGVQGDQRTHRYVQASRGINGPHWEPILQHKAIQKRPQCYSVEGVKDSRRRLFSSTL